MSTVKSVLAIIGFIFQQSLQVSATVQILSVFVHVLRVHGIQIYITNFKT